MANGPRCCLLELCCTARAQKVAAIAKGTGLKAEYCDKLLDWMQSEEIAFAPASFQAVVQDIAEHVQKHPKAE